MGWWFSTLLCYFSRLSRYQNIERNIDDRQGNQNIIVREIIWLGNQLVILMILMILVIGHSGKSGDFSESCDSGDCGESGDSGDTEYEGCM